MVIPTRGEEVSSMVSKVGASVQSRRYDTKTLLAFNKMIKQIEPATTAMKITECENLAGRVQKISQEISKDLGKVSLFTRFAQKLLEVVSLGLYQSKFAREGWYKDICDTCLVKLSSAKVMAVEKNIETFNAIVKDPTNPTEKRTFSMLENMSYHYPSQKVDDAIISDSFLQDMQRSQKFFFSSGGKTKEHSQKAGQRIEETVQDIRQAFGEDRCLFDHVFSYLAQQNTLNDANPQEMGEKFIISNAGDVKNYVVMQKNADGSYQMDLKTIMGIKPQQDAFSCPPLYTVCTVSARVSKESVDAWKKTESQGNIEHLLSGVDDEGICRGIIQLLKEHNIAVEKSFSPAVKTLEEAAYELRSHQNPIVTATMPKSQDPLRSLQQAQDQSSPLHAMDDYKQILARRNEAVTRFYQRDFEEAKVDPRTSWSQAQDPSSPLATMPSYQELRQIRQAALFLAYPEENKDPMASLQQALEPTSPLRRLQEYPMILEGRKQAVTKVHAKEFYQEFSEPIDFKQHIDPTVPSDGWDEALSVSHQFFNDFKRDTKVFLLGNGQKIDCSLPLNVKHEQLESVAGEAIKNIQHMLARDAGIFNLVISNTMHQGVQAGIIGEVLLRSGGKYHKFKLSNSQADTSAINIEKKNDSSYDLSLEGIMHFNAYSELQEKLPKEGDPFYFSMSFPVHYRMQLHLPKESVEQWNQAWDQVQRGQKNPEEKTFKQECRELLQNDPNITAILTFRP